MILNFCRDFRNRVTISQSKNRFCFGASLPFGHVIGEKPKGPLRMTGGKRVCHIYVTHKLHSTTTVLITPSPECTIFKTLHDEVSLYKCKKAVLVLMRSVLNLEQKTYVMTVFTFCVRAQREWSSFRVVGKREFSLSFPPMC